MSLTKRIKKRLQKHIQRKKNKAYRKYKTAILNKYTREIFPDLTVKNGPFSGIKYPVASSVGSTLFPKLLGSYEHELSDILDTICKKEYSSIIDIGCAEGYYAVGLASRIDTAHVYAFDTDENARELCRKMFLSNDIPACNFTIGSFCNSDTLKNIEFGSKALIVIDCEGYEKELFNTELLPFLKNHDILIETHDCIDINISTYIYNLFKDSHNISIIESIDDIQKAKKYNYDEISTCTLEEKYILLKEDRAAIMEWFYMEPKINN